MDEERYLYLTGRRKEIVICAGQNVSLLEVETALRSCSGVIDGAVVGLPHPVNGEQVAASVVLDRGVTLDAVRRRMSERLASYKCPTRYLVVDEIARNSSGKAIRSTLVDQFA
jgi:acyl-CoA synthetase (AMP-forming)/AMP-acid ligase II